MHSMEPGYEPKDSIMQTVREMSDGETVVFVCHPGYLDRFILENSSLTTDRTKEVDALIDPELRAWLGSQPDLRPGRLSRPVVTHATTKGTGTFVVVLAPLPFWRRRLFVRAAR